MLKKDRPGVQKAKVRGSWDMKDVEPWGLWCYYQGKETKTKVIFRMEGSKWQS